LVHTADDLPTESGGFIRLEQNKGYVILNQIVVSATILIPAGWRGFIRTTDWLANTIVYVGGVKLFATLGFDGAITSIADSGTNPGVKSTVTSNSHGLSDGDYINITDTVDPLYSLQKLIVSNVTVNTFDVDIVFVATDTGNFDTGALTVIFENLLCVDPTPVSTAILMDIDFTKDPIELFSGDHFAALNFLDLGEIRNVVSAVCTSCQFSFTQEGLIFGDCENSSIDTSLFICINSAQTNVSCLIYEGVETSTVVILNTKFTLTNPAQHAVFVNNDITVADINITTCPDNGFITDYFNPSGRDQTDKQIITINNGIRQNSEDLAEIASNVILIIQGLQNIQVPIQNTVPVTNDFVLDVVSEGFTLDDATGIVTYNGRAPKRVRIEYSVEIEAPNPTQNIEIELKINTTIQGKTMRSAPTVAGTFIPIQYLGGYFMINPGDTLQLFRTNTVNDNDTNIQNMVVLVR